MPDMNCGIVACVPGVLFEVSGEGAYEGRCGMREMDEAWAEAGE